MIEPAVEQLLHNAKKVHRAPPLRTVNGLGTRLSGCLKIPGVEHCHIAGYWLVLLFFPVIPLAVYVVSGTVGGPYRFYLRLRVTDLFKAYGTRAWWLYMSAWFEGAFTLTVFVTVVVLAAVLFHAFKR